MANTTLILTCAGSGARMGVGFNKLLITCLGKTIFQYTLEKFLGVEDFSEIIITYASCDYEKLTKITTDMGANVKYVEGGKTRLASVYNALQVVSPSSQLVMVHDGARPFVSKQIIAANIENALEYGGVVTVIPVLDTLKKIDGEFIKNTPTRENYAFAQTPQTFDKNNLVKAYAKAVKNADLTLTDDASVYEKYIGKVKKIDGDLENIKITSPSDLRHFAPADYVVGIGADTHILVKERKLILGGVEIPHYLGLLGHSDADVLLHAIMDSLLSAGGLRDIGVHFPDNDPDYKNISSLKLLEHVYYLLSKQGYVVNNISAVIVCEKPKLGPYIQQMRDNIATVLNVDGVKVAISCTTTEGTGEVGEERIISVSAISSLIKA